MRRRLFPVLTILILAFVACAPAGAPTTAPQAGTAAPAQPAATTNPQAAGTSPAANPASNEPIRIGVPQSLTGPSSNFGKNDQIAFEMARKEINDAGGINGRPLELNYVDVQAKPELAASAAERMINVDNTPMILGGDTSATCAAIAKLAQQNKVPYLMHVCLSDDLTRQGWEYVFRIPPPIGKGLDGVTGFLQSVVKPQSFFLVHENTQYGTGIEASLKEWASDNQISYSSESFEPGSVDFRPILTKVKAANPDAVMFGAYLADTITLTRQSAELGIKPKIFIGSAGALYPEWLQGVGDLADGYIMPTQGSKDVNYPGAAEFWTRFDQAAGHEATFSQASAYASVYVLKDLFERVPLTGDLTKDREALRNGLAQTDVMTVFGPVKFENFDGFTNQTKLPALVLQIQKNQQTNELDWFTIWPSDVASAKPVYPVPGLQ